MSGNRMDTDIISGPESGMSTVLVLSSVSTRGMLRIYAERRARRRGRHCGHSRAEKP